MQWSACLGTRSIRMDLVLDGGAVQVPRVLNAEGYSSLALTWSELQCGSILVALQN